MCTVDWGIVIDALSALAAIGAVIVALIIASREGRNRKREQADSELAQARLVQVEVVQVTNEFDVRINNYGDPQQLQRDTWSGPNTAGVIFPSSTGTLCDPDNFGKQWREVRDDLGLPDVSSHSFRKSVATMIDDAGLSDRIAADQLGLQGVDDDRCLYEARRSARRGGGCTRQSGG